MFHHRICRASNASLARDRPPRGVTMASTTEERPGGAFVGFSAAEADLPTWCRHGISGERRRPARCKKPLKYRSFW
jgi:hypothetical protein